MTKKNTAKKTETINFLAVFNTICHVTITKLHKSTNTMTKTTKKTKTTTKTKRQ